MPRLPDSFAVWFGEMPTPSSVKAKYAVQVSTVKQPEIGQQTILRLMSDGIAGFPSDSLQRPWPSHSMRDPGSCAVQHVHYVDEMAAVLADMGPAALHLLSGTNTDSGRKTTVCCT